jgi:hypothetical protein
LRQIDARISAAFVQRTCPNMDEQVRKRIDHDFSFGLEAGRSNDENTQLAALAVTAPSVIGHWIVLGSSDMISKTETCSNACLPSRQKSIADLAICRDIVEVLHYARRQCC